MGLESKPLSLHDFNNAPPPRVLKTHAPFQTLLGCRNGPDADAINNFPKQLKIIVMSRNPLDACVSGYYHAFNPSKSGWPFDAWAHLWLAGKVPHGSWFPWVRDWHAKSLEHPDRILWMQYEDLKESSSDQIRKLADFLGIRADDEFISRVAAATSFENMKESAVAAGGDAEGHLRKGVSGDWRNHFSADTLNSFRETFDRELRGTGLHYSLGDGEEFIA